MNNSAYVHKVLKALNEADENSILIDRFQAASDSSPIIFNGETKYTGQSRIELELSVKMPDVLKHYVSEKSYDQLSEEQFKDATDKIKNALHDVSEEFAQSLRTKLASYGLIEGDNHG